MQSWLCGVVISTGGWRTTGKRAGRPNLHFCVALNPNTDAIRMLASRVRGTFGHDDLHLACRFRLRGGHIALIKRKSNKNRGWCCCLPALQLGLAPAEPEKKHSLHSHEPEAVAIAPHSEGRCKVPEKCLKDPAVPERRALLVIGLHLQPTGHPEGPTTPVSAQAKTRSGIHWAEPQRPTPELDSGLEWVSVLESALGCPF